MDIAIRARVRVSGLGFLLCSSPPPSAVEGRRKDGGFKDIPIKAILPNGCLVNWEVCIPWQDSIEDIMLSMLSELLKET